ncbi:MAG: cobyrinate a,c-diamide synthase [Candidatus Puniceispirillales bacterium WSBS_2018_MAG_OTU23]
MAKRGVIIAGLSSSSGKTFLTLGLLAALNARGASIAAAKTGPDYIDPGFHTAALGKPSVNLDGFAMSPDLMRQLSNQQSGGVLIAEGVMGLYDGGAGSAVALARNIGAGIVLVMDIRGQSETAAELALALTLRLQNDGINLGGVILNRSQSERHGNGIAAHCDALGVKVLGIIPELTQLKMPSRHLGLVQATELSSSDALKTILTAAAAAADQINLDEILNCATPLLPPTIAVAEAMPPMGQRIAVAHDAGFGFSYTHIIEGWKRMGVEVSMFSPLADEAPPSDADMVFLPGGYPELYLNALANAKNFRASIHKAAENNIAIYGECGGYMALGQAIIGKDGIRYPMLGLLDLETSFLRPKRVLGYRKLSLLPDAPFGLPQESLGHEFHFTQTTYSNGAALFNAADKNGTPLGEIGLKKGSVAGSYAHCIAAKTP